MILARRRWRGGAWAMVLILALTAPVAVGGGAAAEEGQPKVIEKRKRAETRFHTPPPNAIKIGPIQVALTAGGRTVAGKLQFSVVAVDEAARGKLQAGQDAIYGIVYPLAIKLYAAGRPLRAKPRRSSTPLWRRGRGGQKRDPLRPIRAFKSDAKAQLNSRFGDAVEVVLLKMLY